jgi:hypothetical protein
MSRHASLSAITALSLMCAVSSNAMANVISGEAWMVSSAISNNATIANALSLVGSTTPNVTFDVNSPLNFQAGTGGSAYTIGGFLGSGGATNIVYHGATSSTPFTNWLVYFTGQVTMTHGQTFDVQHDDGLQLKIGGTMAVDLPGPTGPVVTTYTWAGATGNYAFQLAYGECCTAPAVLATNLPLTNAVPEPSTWAMMLLGFAGLGFAGYRRSRKEAVAA